MRLLLDTHVLLWWLVDDRKLSRPARQAIADPTNAILVSAASVWEIAIKKVLGRIEVDTGQLEGAVVASGFEPLYISFTHAAAVAALPPVHRDPFDRMLAAQSITEKLRIMTHDEVFKQYDLAAEGLEPVLV